ncbi:LRR receptor-like serine threonine-protein kinase [Musa troglodytarum]|uniref:non-specific serine/threonine protein kinase n=1 Tax=Musa troglodytarum TaxID=320322 RepID=A0A9E7KX95_9LILI|nr:LRR receptor-like serine threonine-protein kinase [Musa troglodytarum]
MAPDLKTSSCSVFHPLLPVGHMYQNTPFSPVCSLSAALMAPKCFFSSLFVLFFSFCNVAFSFEPLNMEVEALIAIRSGLHDPHGVLSNWDEDSVDPCSWAMITCSPDNLVIGLGAPSQNLSGTLSGRIGNLTNLQQVLLQNNNISGELPPELGLLPKLQSLDLSNNGFSGSVPESLGHLASLRYLRLNNNSLSGSFPESLSRIPQLSFLSVALLSHSRMDCAVRSILSRSLELTKASLLSRDLSYNNLSGPVPLFPTRTFNIVGNPLICGNRRTEECSRTAIPSSLPFLLDSSAQKRSKAKKLGIAMGASVGGSSLLLLLALVLFLCRRKRQKNQWILGLGDREEEEGAVMVGLGNLRRFTLRELRAATENFSGRNVLGKGGFGHVYRGRLADSTVVAVKRLRADAVGSGNGEAQFRTEVEMISLAVHRNLLRLLGYCAASGERLLVYPFMPNGSVAARLRGTLLLPIRAFCLLASGKPPLDWSTRKRIALGAARGLLYLHEQCDPKIIHRDVKAANVLLDDCCEAVVGDFGLAKLLDHGDSHVTTAVRGTVGHIAPEYLSTGQSSDKTDVFGFGILLLELISGRRVLEFGKGPNQNQKGAMLDWVRKVYQERKLDLLVDRDLGSSYDRIEVAEMVQVALLCTQYLPSHRPKMSEVVRMLEGDGLADKWEASNRPLVQVNAPNSDAHSDSNAFFMLNNDDDDGSGDGNSDGDAGSGDIDMVEEMELSGPR